MEAAQQNATKNGQAGYQPKINEVAQNFLEDLKKERARLAEDFPLCSLLIDEGMHPLKWQEILFIFFFLLY